MDNFNTDLSNIDKNQNEREWEMKMIVKMMLRNDWSRRNSRESETSENVTDCMTIVYELKSINNVTRYCYKTLHPLKL